MATAKHVLPGLALMLLILVVVWPELVSNNDRFRIDLEPLVGPTGTSRPQVVNARVLGIDSKSRPFQITAASGKRRDEGAEEVYLLDRPKADIVLEDGTWVALTARDGRYEQNTKLLYLNGDVNVFHDTGYEFHTPRARVELADRSAAGDDPVQGQGPLGTLKAEGFRILDGGERVLFTGKARMLVFGTAPDGK